MVFTVYVCTYHDITSFDSSLSSLPESLLSWLLSSASKHIHIFTLQGAPCIMHQYYASMQCHYIEIKIIFTWQRPLYFIQEIDGGVCRAQTERKSRNKHTTGLILQSHIANSKMNLQTSTFKFGHLYNRLHDQIHIFRHTH